MGSTSAPNEAGAHNRVAAGGELCSNAIQPLVGRSFLPRGRKQGNVGSGFIDTETYLGVLRVDAETLQLTAQLLSLDSVRRNATRWHTPSEKLPSSLDLPISQDAKLVLDKAVSLADAHSCDFVRTEHLLLALTAITTSHGAEILQEGRISLGRLEKVCGRTT